VPQEREVRNRGQTDISGSKDGNIHKILFRFGAGDYQFQDAGQQVQGSYYSVTVLADG
jgi:hypothetical protein